MDCAIFSRKRSDSVFCDLFLRDDFFLLSASFLVFSSSVRYSLLTKSSRCANGLLATITWALSKLVSARSARSSGSAVLRNSRIWSSMLTAVAALSSYSSSLPEFSSISESWAPLSSPSPSSFIIFLARVSSILLLAAWSSLPRTSLRFFLDASAFLIFASSSGLKLKLASST